MLRSAVERLCAAATAAALVPIWLFPYFPTQDGPSHLYNAFVLAHYFDAGSQLVHNYFVLNLRLFPNWTTYAIQALLIRIAPPLIAQQVVLSLCVVSIPGAVLYLQKSFRSAADPSALLGVLLAYSYVLFMGFFNFVAGAALFAFTVGFFWRRRASEGPRRHTMLVVLYALFIATYLSHALAFAAALMAIAILAASERRWRSLVEIAPAAAVGLLDAISRVSGAPARRSFSWHLRQLTTFFAAGYIAVSAAVLLIVAIGMAVAIVRRHAGAMAIVSAVLFAGYFLAPWGYTAGGWIQAGWINERLLFLTVLTLPAWIELPWPAISAALLSLAIAAHLAITSIEIARWNGEIGAVARLASVIQPHATVRTIFPMSGVTPQVTPTLHLTGYLALRPDVVDLDDYEALLPDFPLQYRAKLPSRPPDFVVIWRGAQVRRVLGYRIVAALPEIRILQRM